MFRIGLCTILGVHLMLCEKIENMVYYGIVRLSLSQWVSGSFISSRNVPKQGTLEHVSWSSADLIVDAWLTKDWQILP